MSSRKAIVQALILAAAVAIGLGLGWGVLVGWCGAVAEQMTRSVVGVKHVHVRIDGTPLVKTYLSNTYRDTKESTLDGAPVANEAAGPDLEGTRLSRPKPGHPWLFHPGWWQRIFSFNDGGSPPVFWYFIYDGKLAGRGYFVGYDSKAKTLVGYIGASGFQHREPAPQERFPIDGNAANRFGGAIASGAPYYGAGAYVPYYYSGWRPGTVPPDQIAPWAVYLVSADRLVEVDLQKRTSRVLFEHDGLATVGIVDQAVPAIDLESLRKLPPTPQYVAVLGDDKVFLLDAEGKLRHTFAIPPNLARRSFAFYLLRGDAALLTSSHDRDAVSTTDVLWIDRQGRVTKRREVSYRRSGLITTLSSASVGAGLIFPSPAIFIPLGAVVGPLGLMEAGQEPDYADALARTAREGWPVLVAVLALAAVLAWLTWRRQRRFGAARTGVWVSFVFLFGLPGFLGYLFSRRWPARLPCPSCGVSVPRDRPACFACGSDFPEPAGKGIEVFA